MFYTFKDPICIEMQETRQCLTLVFTVVDDVMEFANQFMHRLDQNIRLWAVKYQQKCGTFYNLLTVHRIFIILGSRIGLSSQRGDISGQRWCITVFGRSNATRTA